MIKIGLTGSIGMGKSTVLAMFSELGAAVWDADAAVHRLYGQGGGAVQLISEAFPDAIIDGAVDRARLAGIVLNAPEELKKLEAIVHPLVAADRQGFMAAAAHGDADAAVLDIPLLFENSGEAAFDAVVVVSAPADVQRERVLSRPGMSEMKLDAILRMQLPDAQKREKADYVINTNQPLEETRADVAKIYKAILERFATS